MVLQGALRCVVGGCRGSFRLAITLCGESGLFFAVPGLSYYVIILGRSSRGSGGEGGGGRWQGQVMHRHRLRVRIRALRKDEVGGSMILRYYGVSARPFFVKSRKFPSCLVFMYEKYPARMDDDEAAVTSCAVHLSFRRQRFAY